MSNRLTYNTSADRYVITRRTDGKNSKKVYVGTEKGKLKYAKINEVGTSFGPNEVQSYSTKSAAERRREELSRADLREYFRDGRRSQGHFEVVRSPWHLYPNLV